MLWRRTSRWRCLIALSFVLLPSFALAVSMTFIAAGGRDGWRQAFSWHPPTHSESKGFPNLDLLMAGLKWLKGKRSLSHHWVAKNFDDHVSSSLTPSPSLHLRLRSCASSFLRCGRPR